VSAWVLSGYGILSEVAQPRCGTRPRAEEIGGFCACTGGNDAPINELWIIGVVLEMGLVHTGDRTWDSLILEGCIAATLPSWYVEGPSTPTSYG